METRVKYLRLLTTGLSVLPFIFLLAQYVFSIALKTSPVKEQFTVLFLVTLFPFSAIVLAVHFYLYKLKVNTKIKPNLKDDFKVFVGIIGLLVGLVFWGALYIVTY